MTKHDLFINLTDMDVTYSGEPFKIRVAHYLAQNDSKL